MGLQMNGRTDGRTDRETPRQFLDRRMAMGADPANSSCNRIAPAWSAIALGSADHPSATNSVTIAPLTIQSIGDPAGRRVPPRPRRSSTRQRRDVPCIHLLADVSALSLRNGQPYGGRRSVEATAILMCHPNGDAPQ